jgi:ring-1,2-phenylacetyl-CoA epoxidase subunit PaaD
VSAVPAATAAEVRAIVAEVPDPEIPVLSIADLGILRDVAVDTTGHVEVTITPTYSGCPAMEAISDDVVRRLSAHGYPDASVRLVLSPAWTSDWMSTDGQRKLAEYGVAPPSHAGAGAVAVQLTVRCPRCGSPDTRELSRFASTACKSLWSCSACLEPFDSFKAI